MVDTAAPPPRDPPADAGRLPQQWLRLTFASALGLFVVATTTTAVFHRLPATADAGTWPVGDVAADGDASVNRDSRDELENVVALSPHTYDFEDEDVHAGENPLLRAAPSETVASAKCGPPRFSFCNPPKGGVYFEPDLGSCLPAPPETVYVCNRSPNRFSSLSECRRTCVEGARPDRRCLAAPLFTRCDDREVELNGTRWFSNGTDCEEWGFPLGQCPAQGSSLFDSADECRSSCLQPTDKLSCCHAPEPSVCALEQLRYPYFAVAGVDGGFRCLEANANALQGNQCVTGINQFDTIDHCHRTCVDGHTT